MSWFRRHMGIDAVDFAIQLGITGFVMVLFDEASHNDAFIGAIGAASLFVLGLRRHWALRRQPLEISDDRAAELESRLAEVDDLQRRVLELEERVDFAERLLAQRREPERLERGPG